MTQHNSDFGIPLDAVFSADDITAIEIMRDMVEKDLSFGQALKAHNWTRGRYADWAESESGQAIIKAIVEQVEPKEQALLAEQGWRVLMQAALNGSDFVIRPVHPN